MGCTKQVSRLRKHLRQVHKLCSKTEVGRAILHSAAVLNGDNSESSASSDSEFTDEELTIPINVLDQNLSSDDDGDKDWLTEKYVKKVSQKPKLLCTVSDSSSNEEESSTKNEENCVDFSIIHGFDSDWMMMSIPHFFMSSATEDAELDDFTAWLQSVDGGVKNQRSSNKHKSVLMGILRWSKCGSGSCQFI